MMHRVIKMLCEEIEEHVDYIEKTGRSFKGKDMASMLPSAQLAADLITIEAYKAMKGEKHSKPGQMMNDEMMQENKSKSPMM